MVANQAHTLTLDVTLSLSSAGVYKCRATYPSQEVAEQPLSGGVVNSGEAEIVVFGESSSRGRFSGFFFFFLYKIDIYTKLVGW